MRAVRGDLQRSAEIEASHHVGANTRAAGIGIMAKSRAKKRVPLQQGSLGVEQHALLKKPLDHLGKQIEMPGSYWKGSMSADGEARVTPPPSRSRRTSRHCETNNMARAWL